jgi:hypothetical protein
MIRIVTPQAAQCNVTPRRAQAFIAHCRRVRSGSPQCQIMGFSVIEQTDRVKLVRFCEASKVNKKAS